MTEHVVEKPCKVFVPNKGPHDYSSAWEWGDVVFCTDGFINRKDIQSMAAALNDAMQDAEEDDYILITSLSSLCSIACAIFARRFGCINLLIYEDGDYVERTIIIN